MNRDELLAMLSQLDPEITNAISSGQLSIEDLLNSLNSEQENQVGFEVQRTKIAEGIYFEHNKIEVIERNGQIAKISSNSVWDCGHSQETHEFGGIDSFGHVVCIQCLRWCHRGKHPCCVLESREISDGTTVCDCHTWLGRFFSFKFEKMRVR